MYSDSLILGNDKLTSCVSKLRVLSDAVIGGGLNLKAGEVVLRESLGDYAVALVHEGALEPLDPKEEPVLARDHD